MTKVKIVRRQAFAGSFKMLKARQLKSGNFAPNEEVLGTGSIRELLTIAQRAGHRVININRAVPIS